MSKSLSSQSKIGFYFPQLHSSLPHNSTLIPQSDRTRLLFIRLIFNDICKKLIFGIRSVAFAQEVINTTSVEMQAQVPQDEFTKIDVKELPEAVAQAVAKNYEGATIKEAYVAEKESGKVYKVILTTKDSQEVTVLMNEKGEEVKE